jgi:hypothetical protein
MPQQLVEQTRLIASDRAISHRRFSLIILLDVVLYITLFWRDYSAQYEFLIAHYISFVAISDLAGLFLAPHLRHWFNLFRLISSFSLLVLVLGLLAKGLENEALALIGLKITLILARIIDSALLIKKYGPRLSHLKHFPVYAADYFKSANYSNRLSFGYILIGGALLFFPQLAYWTHYNWGENRLDDILTAFQGQAGLHFCIKLFVFEILVINPTLKLLSRSLIAILFVAQWPFMLGMFYLAPIPVVHVVVEGFELLLMVLAFKYFRKAPFVQISGQPSS